MAGHEGQLHIAAAENALFPSADHALFDLYQHFARYGNGHGELLYLCLLGISNNNTFHLFRKHGFLLLTA